MGTLWIALPQVGVAITLDQLAALAVLREVFEDNLTWHPCECGHHVVVHTAMCDFRINEEGVPDFALRMPTWEDLTLPEFPDGLL